MKKIILSAAAALSISVAQAQISIVGGLNRSNYISADRSSDNRARLGPCFGMLIDFPKKSKVFPQLGILYKANGFNRDLPSAKFGESIGYKIHTIDIPFRLVCSFGENAQGSFFIGAGPYLALNVAATVDAGGDPNIPRADVGAGINFGYRAAHGLMLSLYGQYGFVNQINSLSAMHNYNFGIMGGHTFKKKKATAAKPANQQ